MRLVPLVLVQQVLVVLCAVLEAVSDCLQIFECQGLKAVEILLHLSQVLVQNGLCVGADRQLFDGHQPEVKELVDRFYAFHPFYFLLVDILKLLAQKKQADVCLVGSTLGPCIGLVADWLAPFLSAWSLLLFRVRFAGS